MDEQPKFVQKIESFAERLGKAAFRVKPQPMSPFGTAYSSAGRRMIAASIDTLILTFTIFPLSYYLTNAMLGEVDTNFIPLLQSLQGVADPQMRAEMIKQFFLEGGRLSYLNTNLTLQTVGLFMYCMVCWKHWAATPGKWVTRIVVVDEKSGDNLTYIQGFWRCVGYGLACLPLCLGIIWISIDKRRQGWHDKFASTVVIVKPKASKVEALEE